MTNLEYIRQKQQEWQSEVKVENTKYPIMRLVGSLPMKPTRPILGRDPEILRRVFRNPEKPNPFLIGEPGVGKSTYAQALAYDEKSTAYLVVTITIAKLAKGAKDESTRNDVIALRIQQLLQEASDYSRTHDVLVVLFFDEFHQIPMLSPRALQGMKELMEKSALVNIRLLMATTEDEYIKYILGDTAFDQRTTPVRVEELPKEIVFEILNTTTKRYDLENRCEPEIIEKIYTSSKEHMPSDAQPRASLGILMDMIGEVTADERMINGQLKRVYNDDTQYIINKTVLGQVIQRRYGIDLNKKINISDILTRVKTKIKDQDEIVDDIVKLISRSHFGITVPDKPLASFITAGVTGVGKTELAKQLSKEFGMPLVYFDMGNYSDVKDANRFANDLSTAILSAPNAYLLIDEIEKSNKVCMNILLSVLSDARLAWTKNAKKNISFRGVVVHLTSNLGANTSRTADQVEGKLDEEETKQSLFSSNVLSPELVGRVDHVFMMNPLGDSTRIGIAKAFMDDIITVFENKTRSVLLDEEIIEFIVYDKASTDSHGGGARDVRNKVAKYAATALIDELVATNTSNSDLPMILYIQGQAAFKDKTSGRFDSAELKARICLPKIWIEKKLLEIQNRYNTPPLIDDGLFIPIYLTKQECIDAGYITTDRAKRDISEVEHAIIELVRQGHYRFKTKISDEYPKIIPSDSLD